MQKGVCRQRQLYCCKCGEMGGVGQLCLAILSFVFFSEFSPKQSLEKAEAGGVASTGGTERLVGVPSLLRMTIYPLASLSLTLWCLGVLSGPPHPEPLAPHPGTKPAYSVV